MVQRITADALASNAVTTAAVTDAAITAVKTSGVNTKLTGDVVQVVNSQSGAVATGTGTIPLDDTIPQIGEGNEFLTVAITPTSATNILQIDAVVAVSNSAGAATMIAALFQDATANALAAGAQVVANSGVLVHVRLTHRMTAGTTSATTFRVRAGASVAATTTFNGALGARLFGGVTLSSLTVTEIRV